MEETDEAMVPHPGGSDTRRQVEALAQHSAAVQQRTDEQLGQVQRQQERLAEQTSEYLQAQYDRQTALLEQQKEMRRQMDENRQYLEEQYRLLRAAEQAVGMQGRQLESLTEAIQPHLQARWGAFEQGAAPTAEQRPLGSAAVTVAAGTNLPVPPIYRGSSKKEKREFMDSYAIYTRRIKALNQGTEAKFFVMPLSACIEQGTLVRICGFELFKDEKYVSETEWKNYFLSARIPDNTAFKTLDHEVKSLCMDVSLQDAESRLSRLMTDFYEIVDRLNMEDIVQAKPKKVVGYLVEALHPPAFKSAVKDQLSRQAHKPTKNNIQSFLKWLRGELDSFMRFEAHIAVQHPHKQNNNKSASPPTAGGNLKKLRGDNHNAGKHASGGTGQQNNQPDRRKRKSDNPKPANRADKKCFKCGDQTHGVFQCPEVSGPAEAKELYEKETGKKVIKPVLAVATGKKTTESSAAIPCTVMDVVETRITPDSAAEVSVVTEKLLDALDKAGSKMERQNLPKLSAVIGIGDKPVPVRSKVKLDLRFQTPGGPLILQNVICWVTQDCLPVGVGDLLLSRNIMGRLGYSSKKLIAEAQSWQEIWDTEDADDDLSRSLVRVLAYSGSTPVPEPTAEELQLQEEEDCACFPNLEGTEKQWDKEVIAVLEEKIKDVQDAGATREYADRLGTILMKYRDVFRVKIGKDPPVDMPPMEITLKPGAVPVRCRARRYSPEHREFLKKHIKELLEAGLCFRNPRSRWCSPPHIVRKPGVGNFRMTVDVKLANERVEQVVWPMPILEVEFDRLRGSSRYFSLDFFKVFFQFAMAAHCQEVYSILTEDGVVTPTRVLMGGTNSVAFVQSTVQAMFAEVFNNGLLIWIDDLLGCEANDDQLLKLLVRVLDICASKGLKLNPTKCAFYLREALWCGRVVSGEGVKHDPARIEALMSLPPPTSGNELQQFICALNWMRSSLPAYNKLVHPLVLQMEEVYKRAGGRKKNMVKKILLNEVGWSQEEINCFERCKSALGNALQLAHPDPGKRLCVFTDASEDHWGAAVTQIPQDQQLRPLSEQDHEPLMMLSGTFSGSAKRWAIVEKEAFAIVETCRRADYLLHCADGFALFTDHRNLRYIFDPHGVSNTVPKYTADKLHRWSLLLMAYRYDIYDIAGEENVWADLLSRWGCSFKSVCAIRQVALPMSPQLDESFVWPTWQEILSKQSEATPPSGITRQIDHELWKDGKGRIWVPDEAADLQVRICVIGHFGIAGHRALKPTLEKIGERFTWKDMKSDIEYFVRRCLHCTSTLGGPPQPRVLGEAMHAENPNELIHWDYLFMEESTTGEVYVLVIKDDASKYVWLLPSKSADAEATYNGLLNWFATFGVCRTWVSDQGTHFKNKTIEALQHAMGAHHHFTTARCPWANGTVEVVMREVLRCCRALLSEWRLQPHEWPRVVKIVQMVLNNTPSPALGGVAPITAMMGLAAMGPTDHLAVPGPLASTTLEEIQRTQRKNIDLLRLALDNLHRKTSKVNKAVRAAGRKSQDKKRQTAMAQFDIGDYVLYADVWQHTRSKLKVKWCGPAQVTAATSNWIFEIQN